jgi:hypothetical protein
MNNRICSLTLSPMEVLGEYVLRNNVSLTSKKHYSSLSWMTRGDLKSRRKGNLAEIPLERFYLVRRKPLRMQIVINGD